jgi:D-alanyl-D-alanine carboxypeptidase
MPDWQEENRIVDLAKTSRVRNRWSNRIEEIREDPWLERRSRTMEANNPQPEMFASSNWGPGWPNCSSHLIVALDVDGIRFPGGCRFELHELMTRLVRETRNRGYQFGTHDDPSYGCWGYNCRAISGTSSPSNHSWGLALDINAPTNPQRNPLTTDMPYWMPDLWNMYGFRWGGDYSGTPDAMHYEFMGSPDDCNWYTELARANRLGDPAEEEFNVQQTYVDATPQGEVVQFLGTPVAYNRITGAWCSDTNHSTNWRMQHGLDPNLAVVFADPPARIDIAFH